MIESLYSISGTKIPPLFGRRRELETVRKHLTKPTPDHLSIIGPKWIGKTVFLKGVENNYSQCDSPYYTVTYWDLRHNPPETNDEFFEAFASKLQESLKTIDPDLALLLNDYKNDFLGYLRDTFELLRDDGKKILVILDGIDEVLRSDIVSKNLWDQLRSLAELPSLRLVTGSRRRLRELCATPESRASEFWNIFFPTPLVIGPFSEDDWTDFLKPVIDIGYEFDSSALKEFSNWTGGIPLLASAIAENLFDRRFPIGALSKAHIDEIAQDILSRGLDHLYELWDDCPVEEQSILVEIAQKQELSSADMSSELKKKLQGRGLVKESGNKLKPACRFMKVLAQQRGEHLPDLSRLFGNVNLFDQHIKDLIELRLSQLSGVDSDLKDYIEIAISNINRPHVAIRQLRSIAERGLDIVWAKEIPDRNIPPAWTTGWQHEGIYNPPNGKIPTRRGHQCYLLRLMVDPEKSGSTRVSQSTFYLLDFIQSIGDLGQHLGTENITPRFAAVFSLAAIELCDQLRRDFTD